MSWDAWVNHPVCEHCGSNGEHSQPEMSNYTHNTNGMMRRAMAAVGTLNELGKDHLYALDGRPCSEVVRLLGPAVEWWAAQDNAAMADLEPSNGWGSSARALKFWSGIVDACRDAADGATLGLSG